MEPDPLAAARLAGAATLAIRAAPALALGALGDLMPADVLPVGAADGDGDTVGAGSTRALRREACVRLIATAATSAVLAI